MQLAGSTRYIQAVVLSLLYLVLIIALWLNLADWMVKYVSDPQAVVTAREGELWGLYPNALGYLIAALLLARHRQFPVSRFVFPVAIAGLLTIPLSILIFLSGSFVVLLIQPFSLQLAWLLWFVLGFIPGFMVAQLLRFPRSNRLDVASRAVDCEVVSNSY